MSPDELPRNQLFGLFVTACLLSAAAGGAYAAGSLFVAAVAAVGPVASAVLIGVWAFAG